MTTKTQAKTDADFDKTSLDSKKTYTNLTEQELLAKPEKSREHSARGMFIDATAVSGDIRAKYGL